MYLLNSLRAQQKTAHSGKLTFPALYQPTSRRVLFNSRIMDLLDSFMATELPVTWRLTIVLIGDIQLFLR